MSAKIGDVEISWLNHSSFKIKSDKLMYIDPFQIQEAEKADIILITHSHFDHCSIADITKIAKDGTTIICPAECQSTITKVEKKINMQIIQVGDELSLGSIKIKAFPAYNIKKQFHPKSEGWVGYLIKTDGVVIYHAGDTDFIPEIEKLTGFAKKGSKLIALLPIDGNFTMNVEEAARVAAMLKPFLAVPMHYKSREDAENFCRLCQEAGIKAEMLNGK
jgi:L-ascorbate metabolism protein UlaG (beta-lactamase superfamily)